MSTRKSERAWIFGAAAAVVALGVVLAFAVSYSPAEPTEEPGSVPVFDGSTGVPGTGNGEDVPVGGGNPEGGSSSEAPATSSEAPATSSEAPATSSEAPATSTEAQAATTEDSSGSTEAAAGGDAAAGQAVFAANCAGCHAADGTGGVGPDLTTLPAAADPHAVADQVEHGGGGMPAFDGQLSDQDIENVAAYVSQQLAKQ